MNISSVVLHAQPQHHPALLGQLTALPGVEVHASSPEGKLVLTLEGADVEQVTKTYGQLHEFEGVLSVSLVYQYSEDDTDSDPEEAQQ